MRKAQIIFNVSMVLALCVLGYSLYTVNVGMGLFAGTWILVDTLAYANYIKHRG